MAGFLTFYTLGHGGSSMAIYERIRNLREDRDWTQQQVAEMLHTSRTSYCAYENGKTEIGLENLIRLAEIYHTSVDYLLGLTDEPKPYPRKKKK